MKEYKPKPLTRQQMKALWLFCTLLAEELEKGGYTQKSILEKAERFDIPPTKDFVHDILIHFQKHLFGTDSFTQLKKQEEIDKLHEVAMRTMGQEFGIEHIPFPTQEQVKDSKIYINDSNIR